MISASKNQIQKIHVLLNQLGLLEQKAELIWQLTEGRTESARNISIQEAKLLIRNLSEFNPSERIKSLIFSLAYQTSIIYGDTMEDKRMNAAKLNLFLKERGAVKKELKELNYQELIKVHRQFEGILRNQKKTQDSKEAKTAVKYLLDKFNLQVK